MLFALLRLAGADGILTGVLTVLLAMPVGSIAPAVASAYGIEANLPARGIVVTTVCSVATFPGLAILLTL